MDLVIGRLASIASSESATIQIEVYDGLFGVKRSELFTSDCVVDTTGRENCSSGNLASYTAGEGDIFKLRVVSTANGPAGLEVCMYGYFE